MVWLATCSWRIVSLKGLFLIGVFVGFIVVHLLLSDTSVLINPGKLKWGKDVHIIEPIGQKKIHFTTKWRKCNGCRFLYTEEAKKYCPRCVFTEDPLEFNSSDAVVFHGRFLENPPKFRNPHQIWIYMLWETPHNERNAKYPTGFENAFNWTMTYRKDSDIFAPYGGFEKRSESPIPPPADAWSYHLQSRDYKLLKTPSLKELKKKKLAVWTASRCSSHGQREVIVKEMKKYIDVDVYGKCGTMNCTRKGIDDCKFDIANKYKFYLSFENGICEDYVTEKYFTTLLTEMVPVVYGGANYSASFPPKSFINVADFDSVKELTNYLTFLDSHPEEYLKYFKWRKDYWVYTNRFARGWCSICDKLWALDSSDSSKLYKDARNWWMMHSSGKALACLPPSEVNWKVLKFLKS